MGTYTNDQVMTIRRGFQAAQNMVAAADSKGTFREGLAFNKAIQKVLTPHLWKVYLGKLDGALVFPSEYEYAIQSAFMTLDRVDPQDGYVMRFALIYALQQLADFKDGTLPAEQQAISHVMGLVGPPVHAYAPPNFIPPPLK